MKGKLFPGVTLAVAVMCYAVGVTPGHGGHDIDKNLIFPHFVVGQDFTTELILMNPQPGGQVSGKVYFFKQDGAAMEVLFEGQATVSVSFDLNPGGAQFLTVAGTSSDLQIGWALVEVAGQEQGADDPHIRLFGSLIYTNSQGGTTAAKVGVVTSRYETTQHRFLSLPVTVHGAVNTGVAMANAGNAALTVALQLKNANGDVIRENATIVPPVSPLAPGAQVARFVTELFPDFVFDDFKGTLNILSNGEGMAAVGLLTDGLILTSIPLAKAPVQAAGSQFTVTSPGFEFSPATLAVTVGDTVTWDIAGIHNVVQVSEATWNVNGSTPNGGFQLPFGGGSVTFANPGTYFYVCAPHAASGMKGRVIVNPAQ